MRDTESLFKTMLLLQHLVELRKTDDIDIYYVDLFCEALAYKLNELKAAAA